MRVFTVCLITLVHDMEVDWARCVICQKDTTELLKCPLQTPGTYIPAVCLRGIYSLPQKKTVTQH